MQVQIVQALSNARDRSLVALAMLPEAAQRRYREAAAPIIDKVKPKGSASSERILDELNADGRLGMLDGQPVIMATVPVYDEFNKWAGSVRPHWHSLDENGVHAVFAAMRNVIELQTKALDARRRELETQRREMHDEAEDRREEAHEAELTRHWRETRTGDLFIARAALILANVPGVDEMKPREMLIALAKVARNEAARIEAMPERERQHEPMPKYARDLLGVMPFERQPYKSPYSDEGAK
jgi:hypothetical protein